MAEMKKPVTYSKAKGIRSAERDRTLGVDTGVWPPTAPKYWNPHPAGLVRRIAGEEEPGAKIPHELEELVLRFPSAPVHGLQRLHEHHVNLGVSENFHSYRVLRGAIEEGSDRARVSRIFLMHTGLNERTGMGLYYRLASQLIERDPDTVCIVRPFPGHLTRYPFQAFGETPLDYYLWDGSHLFRQFIRFMLETQWFLSVIARRSTYRCAAGANLLAENEEPGESRLDTTHLAEAMRNDWRRLYDASATTAKAEKPLIQPNRPEINDELDAIEPFAAPIRELRGVLNLDDDYPGQDGSLEDGNEIVEPALHVLGYSLGGFTAQSVFMSWPFLISSCSTVLAGGALRELAPTGFADPEEWQTVLHSLRYELDDRLMSGSIGLEKEATAGIDRGLFTYLKRTFYEVFQQEYRGSIQTRYEAFRQRMLFIVGGDDPVVRPESVLQSGPKGGLNLLEVGGLGHFLGESRDDKAEQQRQNFWVPEMGSLIHRFADNAAEESHKERPFTWFDADMAKPILTLEQWNEEFAATPGSETEAATVRRLSPAEVVKIGDQGALPGELFERCLDDLLCRVSGPEKGVLFILRNEVPTVMLPPAAIRESAAAHYHDDLSVVRYCHGVTARREKMRERMERICLVLPANAASIMRRMDIHRAYPTQAESAGGRVAKRLEHAQDWADQVWLTSIDRCFDLTRLRDAKDSIRMFDGNPLLAGLESKQVAPLLELAEKQAHENHLDRVASMPDCWIWIPQKILPSQKSELTVGTGIDELVRLASYACMSDEAALDAIQDGQIRMVSVSRARYNPRFRGRLIVDGGEARRLLLHAALCVGLSSAVREGEAESAFH
jgi:pimeloyl-ACP methyl ester carboxylesterase